MTTTGKQVRAGLIEIDARHGKKVFEEASLGYLAGTASAIEDRLGPARAAEECYKLADKWARKTAPVDVLAPQDRHPPMLKGTIRKNGSVKFEDLADLHTKPARAAWTGLFYGIFLGWVCAVLLP